MKNRKAIFITGLGCLVWSLWPQASISSGQDPEESSEGHVVVAGDSLWTLAEELYQDPQRWQDIWKLNPTIGDPDRLEPGQRLQLPPGTAVSEPPPPEPLPEPPPPEPPPEPPIAPPAPPLAKVVQIARRVEEQSPPDPWQSSGIGHALHLGHAVRTYEESSAELAFLDGVQLRITEESLVFLRDRKIRRFEHGGAIEIVEGQSDLEAGDLSNPLDVELQIGDAIARLETESSARTLVRARRSGDGSAHLMAFAGSMRVTSGGEEIVLEEGTGTIVVGAGPPGAPEPLLRSPETVPVASAFPPDQVVLTWQPLVGATTYVAEVCADESCGSLVRRAVVSGERWDLGALEPGRYFWRVSGVAASGLDGPPSAPALFTVAAETTAAPPRNDLSGYLVWIALLVVAVALIVIFRRRTGKR